MDFFLESKTGSMLEKSNTVKYRITIKMKNIVISIDS